MGKRGPEPKNPKLTILDASAKRFPNPPPGMTPSARTVWHRVVKAHLWDYFKPQHYDLLRVYCEASSLHKKAIKELKDGGEVITQDNGVMKENPWVGIMDKMAGRMQGLSVKLQITKNATIYGHGNHEFQEKPKSKREGLLFNGK